MDDLDVTLEDVNASKADDDAVYSMGKLKLDRDGMVDAGYATQDDRGRLKMTRAGFDAVMAVRRAEDGPNVLAPIDFPQD